jgi:predicted double-glycine peptidase
MKMKNLFAMTIVMSLLTLTSNAQQYDDHRDHQTEAQRHEGVSERGDHAMGFSHEKTTHHFRLASDGGGIEVVVNDPNDTASLDQIRMHLTHIAKLFKEGNFNLPMLIHGETPPGVDAMIRLKSDINYEFERFDRGARVRIATSNAEAIEAIHEFLRYQIRDHKTGDPLEVPKN